MNDIIFDVAQRIERAMKVGNFVKQILLVDGTGFSRRDSSEEPVLARAN
jgi:hypothetical protein